MVFPFPFFLFVLFIPLIHSFFLFFCFFFLGYSNLKLGMKWRGGNGTYGSLGLALTLA